jgi:hypothetical protein
MHKVPMAQNKFSAGHKSILQSIFTAENLISPVQVKFSQVSYFAELNLAGYMGRIESFERSF